LSRINDSVSVKIGWHNGYGKHLIDIYADFCGVRPGNVFIKKEEFTLPYKPKEYITIHTGSSLDIKNYDYLQSLVAYSKLPVVHVGGEKDPGLFGVFDITGKTTPQELAFVIAGSKCHIGVDSLPAHIAGVMGTDVITLFGATFVNSCSPIRNEDEFVGVN
jgi:ADP-heptose:LPS heptosyltransferase